MIALAAITLLLGPWHGPSLPTANPDAVKYQLRLHAGPKQSVHLDAKGLPQGWIASFCTQTLCSPFSYDLQLDARGDASLEFQVIRTDDAAPKHARATVTANGTSRTIAW